MVNAVEVPEWLKSLPMAPQFYPTETEFADPIAYISKIEKEAAAFGICKIIPPIPKPSKKHVFANLNRTLSKRPDLGSDVNSRASNLDSSKSSGGENSEGIRAVFTTRQQELGHFKKIKGMGNNEPQSTAQKQVWQSGELYTLEQYEAKAKAFSRDILGKIKDVSPLVVETLFWKAASEKPIYVEYANDVPGSAFSEPAGQARRVQGQKSQRRLSTHNKCVRNDDWSMIVSPNNPKMNEKANPSTWNVSNATSESGKISDSPLMKLPAEESEASGQKGSSHNHGAERTASWKLSNSPWNLQVISRSAGSLTRFMLDDIPGVTSPMVYIGMLFSWFAWHVEDHELHSLNYLHSGSPKTWYAVPGEYAYAFERVIHKEAYADIVDTLAALTILGEKTTLVSPEVVTKGDIPCCRLVQNPGEFVVTFPRAYHIGFSHGFNCGEAANFGTPEWLSVAKEAAVRRTIMDHLPMLSHQQLLYLLSMSFISRIPLSLLPGVRSSRLRNRQKEARELLVKKAFIEDVLESNKLVNDLCQRDSSFRAVLWNSKALSPFGGESVLQSGNSVGATSPKDRKPDICLMDGNNQNLYDQITLHKQSMDDFDIFDLSGDFEISSGTLPCVACGILGFPYMCVVQPSLKASREILPADCIPVLSDPVASKTRKQDVANISKKSVSATAYQFNERWDASCGFLRPRIFCLEHAVQTEELLRSKGGVNMLLICHSDFKKIKPTAAMIAEEMGFAFGYKEVSLEFASPEDLNLINLAIDDEPNNCSEDWTSNLCINLKHAVKVRKNFPLKPMKHKLKLCGFVPFATPALDVSTRSWPCRRSRTKRMHRRDIPCGIINGKDETVLAKDDLRPTNALHVETNDVSTENPDGIMHRKTDVHFQYSRRNYRSKPGKVVEERDVSKKCEKPSAETSVGHAPSEVSNSAKEKLKAEAEGTASTTPYCSKVQLNGKNNAQTSEVSEVSDADNSCLSAMGVKNNSTICEGLNGAADVEDVVKDNILDGSHKEGVSSQSDLVNTEPENLSSSAALVNRQSGKTDGETTSRKQKRGLREATLLGFKFDQGGFVKSPCEGLRPRIRKEESNPKVAEDPPAKKKKPSGNPVFGNEEKSAEAPSGTYRCNIDRCQMHFKTRAELSRHKQNRCALEGCGKRFGSHRKAIDHQKAHEKEGLYECAWTDCKMTFSSESLRTEHMQTHSGTRPYKCEFEGCSLAFRYASQLGRHKRRTGHGADISALPESV